MRLRHEDDWSYGRLTRVRWQDPETEIELMEFDEGGSMHTHRCWEHGYVLEGVGHVEYRTEHGETKDVTMTKGSMISIPSGVWHRMIPDHDHCQTYRWLIWYSDSGIWHRDVGLISEGGELIP